MKEVKEEYKIEGNLTLLELFLNELEEIAEKRGFIKRIDVDAFQDTKVIEFQKEDILFGVSLDAKASKNRVLLISGKNAKEILFNSIECFFLKIGSIFYNAFESPLDKKKLTLLLVKK